MAGGSALESMRYITTAACTALLALAACGGGEPAPTPAASEAENAQETARTKLMRCIRDQGIAEPAKAMSGADREKLEEALDGPCKAYASEAFGGTDPRKDPEFQDALTRVQACLRDEGIDQKLSELDREDPKVRAALDACRDELPENLRGGR